MLILFRNAGVHAASPGASPNEKGHPAQDGPSHVMPKKRSAGRPAPPDMRGDTNAGYCSIRFFSASSGLASKGVMTTVVRNSKTKLIPIITAKTKISQKVFCPFSVMAAARKKSWKMVNTHRERSPYL